MLGLEGVYDIAGLLAPGSPFSVFERGAEKQWVRGCEKGDSSKRRYTLYSRGTESEPSMWMSSSYIPKDCEIQSFSISVVLMTYPPSKYIYDFEARPR
jgi:hypothetical protein